MTSSGILGYNATGVKTFELSNTGALTLTSALTVGTSTTAGSIVVGAVKNNKINIEGSISTTDATSSKIYSGASSTYNNSGNTGFHLNANGQFSLGSTLDTAGLAWNGSTLTVKGAITATSGTFTGAINATSGTITNTLKVGTSSTAGTLQVGPDPSVTTSLIQIYGPTSGTSYIRTNINNTATSATAGNGFYLDSEGNMRLASTKGSMSFDSTLGTLTVFGKIYGQVESTTLIPANRLSASITNASIDSSTSATLTVASHGMLKNEYVNVSGITTAGFTALNGVWQVSSVTSTTIVITGSGWTTKAIAACNGTVALREVTLGLHPAEGAVGDSNYHTEGVGLRLDSNNWWFASTANNQNRFRVGDASSYVKWDGTTLDTTGKIQATSGYIGGAGSGWTIGSNSLTNNLVGLYAPSSLNRTNLILNSQFEFDAAGTTTTAWTAGTNTTLAIDATANAAKFGSKLLKMTNSSASSANINAQISANISVNPGSTYTASAYIKSQVAKTTAVWFQIRYLKQDGTTQSSLLSQSPKSSTTATDWTRISFTTTAPADALFAKIFIWVDAVAASGAEYHYVDGVLFEESSVVGTYFDGSLPDSEWTGTAHNSTSIKYADTRRFNLITNPSMEYDIAGATTTGYTASSTGISSIAISTANKLYGTKSLEITPPATAATSTNQYVTGTKVTICPGETYTFSCWVYLPVGIADNSVFAAQIVPYNSAGNEQTVISGSDVTVRSGVWTRVSVTSLLSDITINYQIAPRLISKSAINGATNKFYTDGWLLEESSLLRDYFDGSTGLMASWTGAINNSASTLYETAMYAGGLNKYSAPFMLKYDGSISIGSNSELKVDKSGNLTAKSANISGSVTTDNLTVNVPTDTVSNFTVNLASAYPAKIGNSLSISNTAIYHTYTTGSPIVVTAIGTTTNSFSDGQIPLANKTMTLKDLSVAFTADMDLYYSYDGGTTYTNLGQKIVSVGTASGTAPNITQSIVIEKYTAFGGWNLGQKIKGVKTTYGTTKFTGFVNSSASLDSSALLLYVGATVANGGGAPFYVNRDGSATALSLAQTSDIREKHEIFDADLGLDFIKDLRAVSYKLNSNNERKRYGFIAQEVHEAFSKYTDDFAGWIEKEDSKQQLAYTEFISPMVRAIQELAARNEELEARLAALENK
jgi:hypothetical protein